MRKVLASLLVTTLCACYTAAPRKVVAEPADPIVGDLRCARPRLSILEALYERPDARVTTCDVPAN